VLYIAVVMQIIFRKSFYSQQT